MNKAETLQNDNTIPEMPLTDRPRTTGQRKRKTDLQLLSRVRMQNKNSQPYLQMAQSGRIDFLKNNSSTAINIQSDKSESHK